MNGILLYGDFKYCYIHSLDLAYAIGNEVPFSVWFAPFSERLNRLFRISCKYGHINIVRNLIKRGARDFNGGILEATSGGRLDIIKLMIEHGAKDYHLHVLWKAYFKYYPDIIEFIEKEYKNNYSKFNALCCGGHIEEIKKMSPFVEPYYFTMGLYNACLFDNMDVAKLMIEYGANNFNEGLLGASRRGRLNIVKYMIELGATDIQGALVEAKKHKNVCKYLARVVSETF